MSMSWSNITKFLLGTVLGVALLVGSGAVVAYFLLAKLAEPPPKPYFANDKPAATVSSPEAKPPTSATAPDSTATNAPLEPGAYEARVVYSGGLSLRDSPSLDATRIGGVAYDQQIVILEESPDKQWQRVRLESGDTEGWIKAGNIERLN